MGATKLGVYNNALDLIGQRNLANLTTDTGETLSALDRAWDKGGVSFGGPIYCLELGYWNFATRTAGLVYSPSVEPPFGFLRAFDKPVDWVRTTSVASDPYFQFPMTQYADESDFWFSDLDVIYVKYVSKDQAGYGLDMSIWPMTFTDFAALYLADSICDRISASETRQENIHKAWKDAKSRANGIDGTNKPTQMIPLGSWGSARGGGWGGRSNRER